MYSEYKSRCIVRDRNLCPKIAPDDKRFSLLKPKTNFEQVKAMNLDKLAEKLATVELNAVCVYASMDGMEYNVIKAERKLQWIEWLESEAEE